MNKSSKHYLKESKQIKITDLVREHAKKALAVGINRFRNIYIKFQKLMDIFKNHKIGKNFKKLKRLKMEYSGSALYMKFLKRGYIQHARI